MSEAYDIINKDLKKWKKDVMFPVSLLDELTEDERREIEKKLVSLCLSGETGCFKFLSSLKYYNAIEIFTLENINGLSTHKQCEILKTLFYETNNVEYLNRLIRLSVTHVSAYTELVSMYLMKKFDEKISNQMLEILRKLSITTPKYFESFKMIDPNADSTNVKQTKSGKVTATIKTATGQDISQEFINYSRELNEHPRKPNPDAKINRYYEKDGILIKYSEEKKKAYILVNEAWDYSEELSKQLRMYPDSIPRKFHVYERYPYVEDRKDELNKMIDDGIRYVRLIDKRIAKIDLNNKTMYVLDSTTNTWREIPSLYIDYEHCNIATFPIQFDDVYPIGEPWTYPYRRGL